MTDSSQSGTEIVRQVLERDPVIRNGLARELINIRALARYIQVRTREDISLEALVAAIRRYPIKEVAAKRTSLGKSIAKLSLKNEITLILLRNRPELQPTLAQFAGELDHASGETFRIASTVQTVKVEIDSRNEERLISKVSKRDIIYVMRNLAEIAVELNDVLFVPGTYASVVDEFAVSGVNVLEASSAERPLGKGNGEEANRLISRWSFIVNETEALAAYQAIERLSRDK